MICPTCKSPITGLACRTCAARKSREAYLALQLHYLPGVLDNRVDLLIGHNDPEMGEKRSHIQLFNDPQHSYCGVKLLGGKRKHVRYQYVWTVDRLCPLCKEQFEILCARAQQEVA